jgi:hypothetical protein
MEMRNGSPLPLSAAAALGGGSVLTRTPAISQSGRPMRLAVTMRFTCSSFCFDARRDINKPCRAPAQSQVTLIGPLV